MDGVRAGSPAEAKRGQILGGAREVFLRDGFTATSTDAIAAEAGVSKRTLYAYYPSKEDLFAEVLRKVTIDNPQTMVAESLQSFEPRTWEALRAALVEIAGKIISTMMQPEYLSLLRTIIADSHRFPQLADLFRSTTPERGLSECRALLERAQEHGLGSWRDSEVAVRMFVGPLLSYALLDGLLRPESQRRQPGTKKIEELVDMYLKAIS